MDTTILNLLKEAVGEANRGNRIPARAYFYDILSLDPDNEYALLWLAYLSDDPYKAVDFLEKLLKVKPGHQIAQSYLAQARQLCADLEALIKSSTTYHTWEYFNNPAKKTGKGVPFLGEYLLQQGLITGQQLETALKVQKEFKHLLKPLPIA